jgi:hypothetical protein
MLSTVLRSQRAIDVNIEIMRAFVRLRSLPPANASAFGGRKTSQSLRLGMVCLIAPDALLAL